MPSLCMTLPFDLSSLSLLSLSCSIFVSLFLNVFKAADGAREEEEGDEGPNAWRGVDAAKRRESKGLHGCWVKFKASG